MQVIIFALIINMATKPTLTKGTRDFGPQQVYNRKYIIDTIQTIFKKYGFMPIETPSIENLTTLEGKYGDEGDQLLFRIINSGDFLKDLKSYNDSILADESKDHTFLPSVSGKLNDLDSKTTLPFITEKGLRYDLTVPFARFVVMNRNSITFPFKRYQIQPVWRADRPQKGRYREFWQCDADVVGTDSLLCELDLVQIYHEAFTGLNIPYELRINSRKILAAIAEMVNSIDDLGVLSVAIDKLDKIGKDGVRNELLAKGFSEEACQKLYSFIEINGTNEEVLEQLTQKLAVSKLGKKGIEELTFILAHTKNTHIKIDISLARGLSYYTGCIFEVTSISGSLKSSIGGGGRYDNLTGIFGMPGVSGVGISFGLDRIYDVMEELHLFPENKFGSTRVLICAFDASSQQYGLGVLANIRAANISSEMYPDLKKIGKQLDYANALNIPFAIIIGSTEQETGKLTFKNLTAGTQQELTVEEIIQHLNAM